MFFGDGVYIYILSTWRGFGVVSKRLFRASFNGRSMAVATTEHQHHGLEWASVVFFFETTTYGSVSKPCTPGEHQNSWDLWMFIPLKNGINRY